MAKKVHFLAPWLRGSVAKEEAQYFPWLRGSVAKNQSIFCPPGSMAKEEAHYKPLAKTKCSFDQCSYVAKLLSVAIFNRPRVAGAFL